MLWPKNYQQEGCRYFLFQLDACPKKEKFRINKLQPESCCPITSLISSYSDRFMKRQKDFKI